MTVIRFELADALRERLAGSNAVVVNGVLARVIDGRFVEVDLPDDQIREAIYESLARGELLISEAHET